MITCCGSRHALTDALHRSPVRSPIWSDSRPSGSLTFSRLPHLLGALEDALAYVGALVTIELNASDSNPIVLPVESAPVAVAN
jgi:histidine ammonia-lyase